MKIGDKVYCINDFDSPDLKLNKEYTIRAVILGGIGVLLYGANPKIGTIGFRIERFTKAKPISVSSKLIEELINNPEWIEVIPEKIGLC